MRCIASDKSCAPLIQIGGLSMVGFTDHINIAWSTVISYPDHRVHIAFRKADNSDFFAFIPDVSRDAGSAQILTGLLANTAYTIWIRTETSLHYGTWRAVVAQTNAGWSFDDPTFDGDSLDFSYQFNSMYLPVM